MLIIPTVLAMQITDMAILVGLSSLGHHKVAMYMTSLTVRIRSTF